MWKWLKIAQPRDEQMAVPEKWLGPPSLAVAIAETVSNYVDSVKAGKISYPAHRRKKSSVVEIWRDLRLEALYKLFNFGKSDPFLLSDQRQQLELLACFLDKQPHLEMPQPHGETISDTIQAMWQVYVYLDKVGSEVADRETDSATLKLSKKSILDDLTTEAVLLRKQWKEFETAIQSGSTPLPAMPRTLIEALYDYVTAKTKSVALSAIFGPSYENGIKYMEKLITERGGNPAEMRTIIDSILAAKDPDEFARKK